MKTAINIDKWSRRGVYKFFSTFENATYSLTSEVECDRAYEIAKKRGIPLSMLIIYSVLKSANSIEEFRCRIERGEPVKYDRIDVLTPIKVDESGRFVEVYIPFSNNFSAFLEDAQRIIANHNPEADPYEFMNSGDKSVGVMCVSCIPSLSFTSMTHTFKGGKDYEVMVSNVGKMVERDGKRHIPIAINVHHGLCDGHHIAQFLQLMHNNMLQIAEEW